MPSTALVMLIDTESAQSCFAAADSIIALDPNIRVEVMHVRISAESLIMPTEEVLTTKRRKELETEINGRTKTLKAAYQEWALRAKFPRDRAYWNETKGSIEDAVTAYGKAADLVIVGRSDQFEARTALHAAIFDTGKLFLLTPASWRGVFGKHVAIAWKESDVARRAVLEAIPLFLKRATQVSVLTVNTGAASEHPEVAVALLKEHGVTARAALLDGADETTGELLHRTAHAIGADCLVMGAYRHNELIEWVAGGVTKYMLRHADLPVFMHH